MDVRTMRVRIAAKAPPMVIAGSTICAKLPEPETGSKPSLMEKNKGALLVADNDVGQAIPIKVGGCDLGAHT